jgi:hypothetical protein
MKRIKRIGVLSLLLSSGLAVFMFASVPSWWLYNYVAVRKVFGLEPPPGVKVEQIKKPYTLSISSNTEIARNIGSPIHARPVLPGADSHGCDFETRVMT